MATNKKKKTEPAASNSSDSENEKEKDNEKSTKKEQEETSSSDEGGENDKQESSSGSDSEDEKSKKKASDTSKDENEDTKETETKKDKKKKRKPSETFDLPPGWRVERVMRGGGKTAGRWDNYWFDPKGNRYRSMLEVQRKLAMLSGAESREPAQRDDEVEKEETTTKKKKKRMFPKLGDNSDDENDFEKKPAKPKKSTPQKKKNKKADEDAAAAAAVANGVLHADWITENRLAKVKADKEFYNLLMNPELVKILENAASGNQQHIIDSPLDHKSEFAIQISKDPDNKHFETDLLTLFFKEADTAKAAAYMSDPNVAAILKKFDLHFAEDE